MRLCRSRQAASRTATAMSQRIVQIGQPRLHPGVDRMSTGSGTRQLASLWVLLPTMIPLIRVKFLQINAIAVASNRV